MKHKILFYLFVFSLLINVYLISDYGKRLQHAESKIENQANKITILRDSIQVLNRKVKVGSPTIE